MAATQRQAPESKARLAQVAGDRPASATSGAPFDSTASGPAGVAAQAAGTLDSAEDTSSAPRSRDGNGGDGIAAAALPAQAADSQATAGASANPSADPSQVASILQSGAPPPVGTAAQAPTGSAALTGSAASASPNAAPLASLTGDMTMQAPTPAVTSASSSVTTAAASLTPQAAHASPVSQVAPALMTLATSATGTQRLMLRLDPADLGTVEVRIDRPADAPAHVDIGVSRPETLTLMLRDQTQLQHTLDQAGVPAEGRTISFHLTGQDADSQSRQAGGFGQSASDHQTTRNGSAARDATDPDENVKLASPVPLHWQRVGLDITA
jgi:flagellar hook-length control protein FliK